MEDRFARTKDDSVIRLLLSVFFLCSCDLCTCALMFLYPLYLSTVYCFVRHSGFGFCHSYTYLLPFLLYPLTFILLFSIFSILLRLFLSPQHPQSTKCKSHKFVLSWKYQYFSNLIYVLLYPFRKHL